MSDRIPTEIGKYHIVEVIGEGAMGVVYRATDSVLDRTVAIKVMSASIARQDDLRRRFLREAQAAGSLQHPNVVTIYDLGEVEGHLFIAMEFVYGSDLEQLMVLSEPMKLQTKLDIIVDVLNGLAYAHKKGIVHRDIKPANIRVGEDGRAKIMDFGVAHLASSSITRTGLVVGTPSYMAPEQVMGHKALPETDIFAVGAVLYQLLTGEKPFEAPTLQSLFYKIVTDMPKPVSEMKPGLAPALDRITNRALAKDATARYHNALDMAADISAIRAELSGAPYPATMSLTGTGQASAETPAPAAEASLATQGTQYVLPRRVPMWAIGAAAVAAVALVGWFALGRNKAERSNIVATSQTATSSDSLSTVSTPPASTETSTPTEMVAAPPAVTSAPKTEPEPKTPAAKTPSKVPAKQKPEPVPVRPRATVQEKAVAVKSLPVPAAAATSVVAPPIVTQQAPRETPKPTPTLPQRPAVTEPAADPTPEKPKTPTAEVANAVAAYARAIESRDIGAVRRAYPGLTSDQARGFEQFFDSARNINVTFRVVGLEANGNSADARLVGTYEYTSGSKIERQPVSFAASLRYDGNSWRLTSVR